MPALRADPGPAVDPRVQRLLEERDVRGDRRRAAASRSSHADPSLEGQTLPPAAISASCSTRSPLAQLRAIYSSQGQNLEFRQPLLLGDTRDRIDPHRRLDAADPPGPRTVARPGARRPRCSRSALSVLGRDAAGAAAAAADSRHPQRADAARQGRVRRPAGSRRSRTSSASSAPSSTPSASSCRRTDRRWPARSRTWSRRSSSSRTRSRSSTRAASCCSRTPRCARCCRTAAPGASLDALLPPDHPLRRLSEQTLRQPAVARPAVGGVRRQRRAPGDDARDQRSEGRAGRHHADRAQPRVPEPGAVDGALLAEAGGARPPVGRRGARGEEPAERDDDSPRAAAAAGLGQRPSPGGRARRGRRVAAGRRTGRSPSPSRRRSIAPRRCSTSTSSPTRSAGSTKWCRGS